MYKINEKIESEHHRYLLDFATWTDWLIGRQLNGARSGSNFGRNFRRLESERIFWWTQSGRKSNWNFDEIDIVGSSKLSW